MKYLDDLKNASAAEFDEAEADWGRLSGECSKAWLCMSMSQRPRSWTTSTSTPTSTSITQSVRLKTMFLEFERAAHDWVADTLEWGKVAKARIEAKRKTEKA